MGSSTRWPLELPEEPLSGALLVAAEDERLYAEYTTDGATPSVVEVICLP